MRNQRGFVTLGVTLMMLTLVSFNSFISMKGSLLKQQSSNNIYYAEQSFQHAELGINRVKSNINQYLIEHPDITQLSDIPSNQTNLSSPNNYTTSLSGNKLVSTGYNDGIGFRKITQIVQLTVGSDGAAALNSLGTINLGGSTSATSAKAGGAITGNVPDKSYANSNEFKVALLDHNNNILKDSQSNIIYRSMTSDEYFLYFFGGLCPIAKARYDDGDITAAADCIPEAKLTVTSNPKGYICNAADCSTKVEDDKITNAYNLGKRIFWLENGGIDHKVSMGTEQDPVLIFIMNIPDASKAAKINAESTIAGILYVDVMDSQTTINCSCLADAVITSLESNTHYEDDLSKPIYTLVSTGGIKCTSNSGCADSKGTIIPKNSRYVTTYQQKLSTSTTSPVYGNYSNITLNTPAPSVCTINSCEQAIATSPKSCSGGVAINDVGKCSFISTAVSGSNNIPVQIEMTGTWNSSGSGHSIIQGAVITSGNYDGTGNAAYIKNSNAISNTILGGIGGHGFISQPPTLSVSGWSDMN